MGIIRLSRGTDYRCASSLENFEASKTQGNGITSRSLGKLVNLCRRGTFSSGPRCSQKTAPMGKYTVNTY